MKVNNPSLLISLSGIIVATAGLAIATSAPSQAETFSIHQGKQVLAEQQFDRQLLKDDDKDDDDKDDDDDDKVPESIKKSILEKISEQTGTETSILRIVKSETKTWSDGCLGLGQADTMCTQALVPGWLVWVTSNNQRMVYRTDAVGSVVMLDKVATETWVSKTYTETSSQRTSVRRTETVEQVSRSTQMQSGSYNTTAQMQSMQVSRKVKYKDGFSLAILQPSGKFANVIARVSLKAKTDKGYSAEKLLGDFKYKINKKAKFKNVKPGDRIVVRLYDLNKSLIGYSQFELLSEYTVVNLILSEQPTEYRVVRTVYGVDTDDDDQIDTDNEIYSYFTQISGGAGERRVTFISDEQQINVSQFQLTNISTSTNIAYPSSFSMGEYALSSQTMSVFSSDLGSVLTSIPGKVVQMTTVAANSASIYDVNMMAAKYTSSSMAVQASRTVFADVSTRHWAKDFIVALAEQKIIEGYPDGFYRPDRAVTRAEFATMLSKAFQVMKVREGISFTDVSSEYWAYQYIQQAYEMGFFGNISSSEFNPKMQISRLDIITALVKGLNYTSTTSTTKLVQAYTDISYLSSDMRTILVAATERGLIVNYPDVKKFKPGKIATRAEVAALIYQAMVSNGQQVTNISSPYVVGDKTKVRGRSNQKYKRHCNQGIGNGAEGCDPGNSRPHGGSNDEGGRTPGGRNR